MCCLYLRTWDRSFGFLHPSLFLQPENTIAGPRVPLGRIVLAGAEAQAVLAFFINVQIEKNSGLAQGGGELKAVLDWHGFVLISVPDEARRSIFFDLKLVGE